MTTQEDLVRKIRTIESFLRQKNLSQSELDEVMARMDAVEEAVASQGKRTSTIMELQGLGKEIWQDIDVDEYVREERRSWR